MAAAASTRSCLTGKSTDYRIYKANLIEDQVLRIERIDQGRLRVSTRDQL